MRRIRFALVGLACMLALAVAQTAAAQDEKRIADLEKKVARLEEKVATLEALLKVAPKSGLELKLVGNWAAPDGKGSKLSGLRFERDGKCRVVFVQEKEKLTTRSGTYELTGKVIDLVFPATVYGGGMRCKMTIVSISDKELVVKGDGDFITTDEVKLEKQ